VTPLDCSEGSTPTRTQFQIRLSITIKTVCGSRQLPLRPDARIPHIKDMRAGKNMPKTKFRIIHKITRRPMETVLILPLNRINQQVVIAHKMRMIQALIRALIRSLLMQQRLLQRPELIQSLRA